MCSDVCSPMCCHLCALMMLRPCPKFHPKHCLGSLAGITDCMDKQLEDKVDVDSQRPSRSFLCSVHHVADTAPSVVSEGPTDLRAHRSHIHRLDSWGSKRWLRHDISKSPGGKHVHRSCGILDVDLVENFDSDGAP